MPISFAPAGERLTVRKISADDKIRRRLQELGITVGGDITVLSSTGGNIIVAVKEGRLCLDKDLAAKILVA